MIKFGYYFICTSIVIAVISVNRLASQSINVMPGVNVEVGEEVYFDAVFYSSQYGDSIQCEWDFDDGYYLKAGAPMDDTFETGLAVVHYFMRPGVFQVRLTASHFNMSTNPPTRLNLLAADSITLTVTGEAPLAGFELWHAPFHARTAQYLYAVVPSGYSPSQVTARIERTGEGYSQELKGVTEGGKQRFLLNNAALQSGDYIVTAELMNGNTIVSRIQEKFSKPYDGAPTVGIDENNAFVLNGTTLFFPIGPFMLNEGEFPIWRYLSNTLHTEGWYPSHSSSTWFDFISKGNSSNMMSVGPTRWEGFIEDPYTRNSNPNALAVYVEQSKNSAGLLGWCWDDEPSLGGRYQRVPAPVLAAWNYRTTHIDLNHPSSQQYYGFDYFEYPNNNPLVGDDPYNFMRNSSLFGGKKTHLADFYTHDAYLIEYKEHISLDFPDRGVVDLWLENLDNFNWNMAGLVPLGTFVEPQNVTSFQQMSGTSYLTEWDAGPTPGDVRTQMWSALVHGIKYIGYFEFFSPTPAENMSAMAEFKEAVTDLAPIILSAPSSRIITHNAITRGRRVDVMVRESSTDIYVFAVRITEPESEWSEVPEPETITVQFNTGVSSSVIYDDFPKYSWKYLLVNATAGRTNFNIVLPGGGMKRGSVIVSAVKNPAPSGYPATLHDRWTGKEYDTALDTQGNLKYGYDDSTGNIVPLYPWQNVTGTINYATGNLNLRFDVGIPAGTGYVQVAYAPANRVARTIIAPAGNFKDALERNAVRIYRIPKSGSIGNLASLFMLYQNFPNPFNPSTTIKYYVPYSSYVKIIIYDLLGRQIRTLFDDVVTTGTQAVEWDGKNSHGIKVSSGVYFYQLKSGSGFTKTQKMILLN
jgi:hypothetical protein